jgi:uncharacterized repeat protein (TIGR01451 family)
MLRAGIQSFLLLGMPLGLLGQGTPEVRVDLTAKRVVVSNGQESLVSADKANPGDVIQYEAIYKNSGAAPVKNVAATVPIPSSLALVDESAKPPADQASVDGKNFNPIPLTREVKNKEGVMEKQPVPLAEYRALRWVIHELPAGGSTTVLLRARVLTETPSQ